MKRGKKPKPPKESAGGWWRPARPVAAFLLTLAFVAAVLVGVSRLGTEAALNIGPRDRYRVKLADVQCDTPPGTDRATFLAEVRYVGDFPESFDVLAPADRHRLTAAFAAHPWVEAVESATVDPPAVVTVRLKFRTPVLAVRITGGAARLVDAHGVLLPRGVQPPGVAQLVTPVPAPATPDGQVWADDTVRRAVDLVAAYQPTQLEKTKTGSWRLTRPGGKAVVVDR